MIHDFPEARAGRELTPSMWQQAKAFVLRNRLFAGPGIRLQWHKDGTIISAPAAATPWHHPFKCALKGQTGASVATGWLNGSLEPEIDGIPLSGDAKHAAPLLQWIRPKLAEDGTGYIALEAGFDEQWNLLEKHAAAIVQVAFFDRDDDGQLIAGASTSGTVPLLKGRRARWPLARLKRNAGGQLVLFQITHGDLQVKPQPKTATSETGRAFFY